MLRFLLLKSFRKRKFVSLVTIVSIALSLSLFFTIGKMRQGVEQSFTNSISNADLIVGARSGPLQLLLYTVFHMGSAVNNITMDSYEKISSHPAVAWTIPISLGDSYRGYRVVATDENFYEHYQFYGDRKVGFIKGSKSTGVFDVVLGSTVARALNHKLNDSIVLSHGISKKSLAQHDQTPFKVVGILSPTGTPIDKSVFITLYGMEAIHIGWERGYAPEEVNFEDFKIENLKTTQITSFILRTKNRIALLSLQRFISTYSEEPLMAIIPALTLLELWGLLDKLEITLLAISLCVVLVGFLSLLIVLYMSLNGRKREIIILRSVGVSAIDITKLLLSEAFLLTTLGVLLGFIFHYLAIFAFSPILESQYGLILTATLPNIVDIIVVIGFIIVGTLFGGVPAFRAYRRSSKLHLSA